MTNNKILNQDGSQQQKPAAAAAATATMRLDNYQMSLSPRFVAVVAVVVCLGCVELGRFARQGLLLAVQAPLSQQQQYPAVTTQTALPPNALPPLFLAPHKPKPSSRYSSRHYDTGLTVGSDKLLINYPKDQPTPASSPSSSPSDIIASAFNVNASLLSDGEYDVEEIHDPAGQHLLIDIENVDGAFLNSQQHLAQAMIDLVDESGLTMLSYHCHRRQPVGVSCAGVLVESHIAVHTWPVQGVLTLDLFTCGPNSLLHLLKDVRALFLVPETTAVSKNEESHQEPSMVWAFKSRGFPVDELSNPAFSDIGTTLLGVLQYPQKEQLAFFKTPYQQVHMYDILDPRYSTDTLDRRMYLDGILRVRERGQAAYAEAMVHPALMAHSEPKRVAIVGAGDGAALREVLKYSSIESVEWMEIDQDLAVVSQEWLWSQCDDFLDVTNCREDPRVNLHYEDGFHWFRTRYGNSSKVEQRQDVIIMDVLNPEDDVDYAEVFFDDLGFAEVLHDALSDDGILAVPLGAGHSLQDAPESLTGDHHIATLAANLEQAGFSVIHQYDDAHGGILASSTSTFLVAFKGGVSDQEWFASESEVQVKIHERMQRTQSGNLPLSYFDGATMQTYQLPSRASEVVHCKNLAGVGADPLSCRHGIDPRITNIPISALHSLDQNVSASQGVLVGMDTCVNRVRVPDVARAVLQEITGRLFESDDQNHGTYNPFEDRSSLTQKCLQQCSIQRDVAAEGIVRRAEEQSNANYAENLAASLTFPSVDSPTSPQVLRDQEENIQPHGTHQPNYTTDASNSECAETMVMSKTGQCLAAVNSIAESITS